MDCVNRGDSMDEKLLEALKTIKAECQRHYGDYCMECPLYSYDNKCCAICDSLEYPCDWPLED